VNAYIPILLFVLAATSFPIISLLIARALRAGKPPASCELKARTLTEEQLWLSCPEYKGTITHESGR
jgi:NADH:ubiquinone oxidoreductase subunit 3 (subunit A)